MLQDKKTSAVDLNNVVVAGLGYVGLSLGIVLSRTHDVTITDVDQDKIDAFRHGDFSFADPQIQRYLSENATNIQAAYANADAYALADIVFIAVPTGFDEASGKLDTSHVEDVIRTVLSVNSTAPIVIRSTIPIGFTESARRTFGTNRIVFSPEFLREGHALDDSLRPSRIVVGDRGEAGQAVKELMLACVEDKSTPCLLCGSSEAEAIKIMSNTYLAMRVSFFNEVDSLAEKKELDPREIIDGIGMDPRIGDFYNNPSFGYGGYCLPKDAKQAAAAFDEPEGMVIRSITDSNARRMDHVVETICNMKPGVVGVYCLEFKSGAGDFRESVTIRIMERLQGMGIQILLYEPKCSPGQFEGVRLAQTLDELVAESDVILANRMSKELEAVRDKVYTRDLYGEN